jgi:deoxycytidylate deaminase
VVSELGGESVSGGGLKPELVVGFVAPTGTSFEAVAEACEDALGFYGYDSLRVRLSDFLDESAELTEADRRHTASRIARLQAEGNRLRREASDASILAKVALQEIRREREQAQTARTAEVDPQQPAPGTAYLVWSLKHPAEAALLRSVYGTHFVLVSVFSPEEARIDLLAGRVCADRRGRKVSDADRSSAKSLIQTDHHEASDEFGQRVRAVFPEADFFVDGSTPEKLKTSTGRAIDVLFGDPYATPTRDEYGMYMASAAALRSAELGRQVGAAITTPQGDVVAVGVNEVPEAGGGQYWPDSQPDHREFTRGIDTADERKRALAEAVGAAIHADTDLDPAAADEAVSTLLRETALRDLIEYGRAVHAEMSAISDAARRGVSVAGATAYVTTFPCHHCARHLVAAGIARLVYIHPYPKSLAIDLHQDSIRLGDYDAASSDHRVAFEAFRGVAPRQYMTLFTMATRKDRDGKTVERYDSSRWPKPIQVERGPTYKVDAYLQREALAIRDWTDPPNAERTEP